MTFSEKAKPLKEKSKLTLSEIAMACNISESMVSRYINGQIIPPEDIARKILELLGDTIPEEEKRADMQTALTAIREIYESRISDLRANIVDLKDQIRIEKREKWIFFILLTFVVIFIFFLFYIDLSNGNIGWFRH